MKPYHFLVAGLLLFAAQPASAFPQVCLKSFKKLSAGELRYMDEGFRKRHNTQYSVEVDKVPLTDQRGFGSCWLHARLSHLEQEIKKKTGKEVVFSRPFLLAKVLTERIDRALESPASSIIQGGNGFVADELIQAHGLVPVDELNWKPRVDFEKHPHGDRLVYFLNARIAKFHEEAKFLQVESKDYLDLQDKARKELRDILKAYTGTLPKKVVHNGETFTPRQLGKMLASDYAPKPLWVLPEVDLLEGNLKKESQVEPAPFPRGGTSSRESIDKIEKRILRSLKAGKSVTLAYENNTLFMDRQTGILSLEAFNTPEGFSPPKRLYRDAFLRGFGHHAVDVVGADVDEQGKIIKLKIKNSWGEDSGDGGYYHMYRDYFESFLTSIYLSDPS